MQACREEFSGREPCCSCCRCHLFFELEMVKWERSDFLLGLMQGLHAWRDKVSREEDESTGYVLPNSLLLRLGMYYQLC